MGKLLETMQWIQKQSNTLSAPAGDVVYGKLLEIKAEQDTIVREMEHFFLEIQPHIRGHRTAINKFVDALDKLRTNESY